MATDRVAQLPDPPLFVAAVGRKGTGKSELAYMLWDSWDGDRVVIDTTGDFINTTRENRPHYEPETVDLEVPPPSSWPSHLRDPDEPRLSLRYVPDHAAPNFEDDMDRVVGMAFAHGDCLVLIEEMGLVAPSNSVRPHTRKALHMGRHPNLSGIWTMPRTVGVDPLALAQCDAIFAFDLPNPDDRKRLAAVTGFDLRDVEECMGSLEEHGYLRFLTRPVRELTVFPPIPLPKRQRVAERHLREHDHDEPILHG